MNQNIAILENNSDSEDDSDTESEPRFMKYQNVDKAIVYGVELEYRKNLGFISPALNNFKWNEASVTQAAQMKMNLKDYIKSSLIERAVNLEKAKLAVNLEMKPIFLKFRHFPSSLPTTWKMPDKKKLL
mgnify:CR=1 FL=1